MQECRGCSVQLPKNAGQEFCSLTCLRVLCDAKKLMLTAHFAEEVGPDGKVEVICTNISGDELAQAYADLTQPVANLYATIAAQLPDESRFGEHALQLALPDGRFLVRGAQELRAALLSSLMVACPCGRPADQSEFCSFKCKKSAQEEMLQAFGIDRTYEKPWFELIEGQWYCKLCRKWATDGHVTSTGHTHREQNPVLYGFSDCDVEREQEAALANFELFHGRPATLREVTASCAGIKGWASAHVKE